MLVRQRKCSQNGKVEKYRAKLVARRDEEYGNDHYSFSPVVEFTITKVLLHVALQRPYIVKHFDFQKTFPNG